MAPRPGGGLYVVVVTGRRSIVTLLGDGGRARPGWPIELAGWTCGDPAGDRWPPLAAPDGSVRVVCNRADYSQPAVVRAFAFDARGRARPGWPVDVPGPVWSSSPRLVGDRLLVVQRGWRLLAVAADGSVRAGAWVEDVTRRSEDGCRYCWGEDPQIGPDGVAYQLNYLAERYEIAAFDLDGLRPGWPVAIGEPPAPGLIPAPGGGVYLTTRSQDSADWPDERGADRATDLVLFRADGTRVPGATVTLPIVATNRWNGAGPGLPSTLVAPDGTAFVFEDGRTASTVYAVGGDGRIVPGWPYRVARRLQWQGSCEGLPVTGCGTWLAESAVGPGDVLYLPLDAHPASGGGSVVAIGVDGRALPGWPLRLARPGAAAHAVVAGPDGIAWVLVWEPEADAGSSATILAIDLAGIVRYRATVIDSSAPPPEIVDIRGGQNHTCALTGDGGVLCWGRNDAGQLGDGTTLNSRVPVPVAGLSSGAAAISVGSFHSCALTNPGQVRCWGANDQGQLGNGGAGQSTVPVAVVGLPEPATAMSAGGVHTCAVTISGAAFCWGSNAYGQLGDGSRVDSRIPVPVAGLSSGVRAVAAGSVHSCALLRDGGAMCWGAVRRLGNGTTGGSNRPVRVAGLSGAVAITAGVDHTCAVMAGGRGVLCWGLNGSGQLGTGSTEPALAPVAPAAPVADVAGVSAGFRDACAVTATHELLCWGDNRYGRLGDGTTRIRKTPTAVRGLPGPVRWVAAGGWHTCALTDDGRVACWGHGNYGELGHGRSANSPSPVLVDFSS